MLTRRPAAIAFAAGLRVRQPHLDRRSRGEPAQPSRPCQVVMQASLPSASASTQNAGASAS